MVTKRPLIVVNFKTYIQGTGAKASALVKSLEQISHNHNMELAVVVQSSDIYRISKTIGSTTDVFAQHIDLISPGANTGYILPEAVVDSGAGGVLINHAEHKLSIDIIEKTVKRAKKLKLTTIICVADAAQAKAVAVFRPDYVAFEPPELIGGDVSVSSAKPEMITDCLKKIKLMSSTTELLVGAGVKTRKDLEQSIRLGASGVLVASGIVCAKNPAEVLMSWIVEHA
ncbi:MAG: triose-phosphate isomerase [Candidatus Aenigmarchaeota archaeon]|nr:triose-phosphate isomerase [Candidatus Aenigmarchaeota archaeon]